MKRDRRTFLGATALIAASPVLFASADMPRRLVFIIQRGAADGLNTVIPYAEPAYARARGALALDPGVGLALDGSFALHPSLVNVHALHGAGQATFFHAVASPYRDRSHFDAQNVLETGGRAPYQVKDGWLTRLLGLVQAEVFRQQRRGLRVWVIDPDVHQGNGTAAIFRDDPTVFTLSLHGAKNFPARKEASDLDVELPDSCGDEAYLAALHEALAQAWHLQAATPPGLAFYVAGADPHEGDRLGRLKLSFAGLAERDRLVFAALRERGMPVAVTMAGGYGRDIADTVAVHRRTLQEALDSWQKWRDKAAGAKGGTMRAAVHHRS